MAAALPHLLDLQAYNVDSTTGFIPSTPPLRALPAYFAAWDELAAQLPQLINTGALRAKVAGLELLDASRLHGTEELRRGFVVLGFLVHGYVWCGDVDDGGGRQGTAGKEGVTVPAQLAEPYLLVCKRLGLEGRETLSYAGLCMWNWGFRAGETGEREGVPELEEMVSLVTFTGTRDEEVFYLVPVLVEMEGGKLPRRLVEGIAAAVEGDWGLLCEVLAEARVALERMQGHMKKLHEQCDPILFYGRVRPFLAGGKESVGGGWTFEMADGSREWRSCIGGSAAQCSTFPAIDRLLGVKHESRGEGLSVFDEMREYMCGCYRDFLSALDGLPSVGDLVESSGDGELLESYNAVLEELARWRSKHIGVVTTHIVSQARKNMKDTVPAEEVTEGLSVKDETELQGTGGTALIPFLKGSRKDTEAARKEHTEVSASAHL
ncbi:uncharacterized protein HMPREF1541_04505 [Cyphellophora europaea CBS 101466]|uniref:Indoleamine 2,3-dioxygenase n=1 Tax=Cyphellophora europaea (strain CBS 101466) TaxID=1220924 RepID=W2RX05_CYPE1|nr:uncharacterized protein HMPREF1541_04505 [Cyphellophora europaea CBS 101466]ETN40229.1 hypothetical protein HMPREF1541_04505 [Cyphellophora europaea CBS 101466]